MRADILSLKTLFQKDVRYVIPTFQRPYVWNQDEQWEPLWTDVRNTAEEFLEELSRANGNSAKAEEGVTAHFLGAVVIQQQPNPIIEIETRDVIDGQQRLTTLQLLLDAAQEVFEQDGFDKEARQLRKLVMNDPDVAEADATHIFKVWPTLTDQEAFQHVMANELPGDSYKESSMFKAHDFFKLQIRQWLGQPPEIKTERATGLVATLFGLLRMVVIDLETNDDANVIFETLNARGTPLLASDLIKNSILYTASEAGLDSDAVYRDYWRQFDESWWRSEVGQGRITRPRIDVFLNYWLTMRRAEEVQSKEVFERFRDYSRNQPGIESVVRDIRTTSESYRELEREPDSSTFGNFLYRWRVMDAGVLTPLLLWLLSRKTEIDADSFARCVSSLESYLVRRMICRMTTKDYNKLFLELTSKLNSSGASAAPEVIVESLGKESADARAWPEDSQLRQAFQSLPLYRLLTRGRLRFVLEALEDDLRSPKSEEEHVKRGVLTIEHIMPQGWRTNWPLPDDAAEGSVDERDLAVHTIGNLTLVNDRLNPALSNGNWSIKLREIEKNSVLHLNKALCSAHREVWDESAIMTRSLELAERAIKIWVRP